MYYSLVKYVPSSPEKLIDTGIEQEAVEAARNELIARPFYIGVVSASDCADDCQPTHVVIDDVVYKLTEVQS